MDNLMNGSSEMNLFSPYPMREKSYEEIGNKMLTMSLEDSGYASGLQDSYPRHSHTKFSLNQVLQSPNDFFSTSIVPECQAIPSQNCVDILGRLSNCPLILEKIFSVLGPDDLVRCCLVSKCWKRVCEDDSLATRRRQTYLSSLGLKNKENLGLSDDIKSSTKQLPPRIHTSTPLAPITASRQLNFYSTHAASFLPDKSVQARALPIKDLFSIYLENGRKLKQDETQMSCPRCSLPALVHPDINLGQCSQSSCRFRYCLLCRCEQHLKTSCPALKTPVSYSKWPKSLASRSCKRKLRRL